MTAAWPLLSSLSEEEQRAVLAIAHRRTFGRGEVVFHRGDPGDTLHLVARGRFATRVVTPLGETATLSILVPGDAFGELALVTGEARTVTVAALEAAETRAIHQRDFADLRAGTRGDRRSPARARRARRPPLAPARRGALPPGRPSRPPRTAELAELYADGGTDTEVPLTQEDIATLAGTSRATANRVLREAEARGDVELRRGRVVVRDAGELARRSGRM